MMWGQSQPKTKWNTALRFLAGTCKIYQQNNQKVSPCMIECVQFRQLKFAQAHHIVKKTPVGQNKHTHITWLLKYA